MGSDSSAGQPCGSFPIFWLGFEKAGLEGLVDNIFLQPLLTNWEVKSARAHVSTATAHDTTLRNHGNVSSSSYAANSTTHRAKLQQPHQRGPRTGPHD